MPTREQIRDAIRQVNNQATFVNVMLRQTLQWPLELDFGLDIQDIAYEYPEFEDDVLSRELLDAPVLQLPDLEGNMQQPWGIFILQFANALPFTSGRGLTGPLRRLLRKLIRAQAHQRGWDRPNLLFICTHEYQHFRFAYFKSAKEAGHAEPLAMFGWEPGVTPRTVCDYNLKYLEWPDDPNDSDAWTTKWAKAFDVEAVTREFYKDYEDVFRTLQTQVYGLAEEEDQNLFVQSLMNRMLFLRFVERKGWLTFATDQESPQDYLRLLYEAGPVGESSWYNSRLKVLFFEGMAIPGSQESETIGQVPYLNGGLFETTPLDQRVTDIPDEAFEPILSEDGLFYRYNFTVEESTPLDIDVAVDPEMLGKVFEKLTNARRQKGSYYTPRVVVSFMCRETLKGYLGNYYASMIDEDDVEQISVPVAKDLLSRLAKVRVVDPACGSGAYLLGMLHELFRLTKLLDTQAETETPKDAYQRKLSIIQNNLYGVDLDEFAINIARLRLWLSLAVEYEGSEPEPLPNLDLKIECGDSLAAPDPSGVGQIDFIRQQQIKELERLKGFHMNPRLRAGYPDLDNEIAKLKEQIAVYAHPDESIEGFDWRVEFAEVWLERGGFDIVLANPPYGVDVNDSIRSKYFNQRSENEKGQSKDSYGIFIARGLQLLRPNGTLSYIVSDTWRTIKSHRPLRKRLLEKTTVFHILDLPSWIFDATVNTGIVTVQKSVPEEDHKLIAGDLKAIEKDNWKALSDNLIAISGHGADIQTETYARYTYPQNLISTYDNLSFFIGSPELYLLMSNPVFTKVRNIADVKQGLATGDNEYYLRKRDGARGSYEILDENLLLADEQIANLSEDEKLNGIDPQYYGGRHFVPYDKGGAGVAGEGWLPNYYVPTEYFINWSQNAISRMKSYTIAQRIRDNNENKEIRPYYETQVAAVFRNTDAYFVEGITWSDAGFYSPTIRLSGNGVFDVKGSRMVIKNIQDINTMTLLGILCSRLLRLLIKGFSNHTVSTQVDDFREMPLPLDNNQNVLSRIAILVSQIIAQQKINLSYPYHLNEQKEIDSLVYQLYGLTEEDIREVELWYCRRYAKLAEAQGLMAEVKEKYAAHLERCKRILEKPPSYWRSNPILQLIAQGESHTLEFKETLEYDVRQNQRSDDVLQSSLKTIAGFLNSVGGTLIIGVMDTGEIKGIERDLRLLPTAQRNHDRFEQKIRSCLTSRVIPQPLGLININFEDLAEGTVCKIEVQSSREIIHLNNDIYVRDGNRTQKLEGRALTDWIQQRTR